MTTKIFLEVARSAYFILYTLLIRIQERLLELFHKIHKNSINSITFQRDTKQKVVITPVRNSTSTI